MNTYKIVAAEEGKFKIKGMDAEGNSTGLLAESFESEADAQKFIDSMGVTPETASNVGSITAESAESVSDLPVQDAVTPEKMSEVLHAFINSHPDMVYPYEFTEADIQENTVLFTAGYRVGDGVADEETLAKALTA